MDHWSNYWNSTQALNSFAEGKQGEGYQHEIAEFWQQQFSQLPEKGTIVDLGTGNGAVAVLAQEFSQKHNYDWTVSGLDAANINPHKLKVKDKEIEHLLHSINFIPNTHIEKAPFEPESVDAFVSQFAFEYSDLTKSLDHCVSCLKPNGLITLLSHHPDSHISKDSAAGAQVIDYILRESPAFLQADLLLDLAKQKTKSHQMQNWPSNPSRQKITSTLHWIFKQLTERFSKSADTEFWCKSTIEQITNIFKQIGSVHPSQLKQSLEKTYLNLEAHKQRLLDQGEASLSEKRVEEIQQYCNANNLSLRINEFNVEEKLFALHLTIQKNE